MIEASLLMLVGLALSAFFSGSETGFYRVNRVRLVLDARGGNWIAARLLEMTNRPSMFVATVLVGNNVANYMTSLAMVIGTHALLGRVTPTAGIVAPLILAPFLFVYGESLPKQLFHDAPNRLLRACGGLLVVATWLFYPITIVLAALSGVLQKVAGQSPVQVRLALARRELQQVFEEGHEAGLIRLAQRGLAQGLFAVANQPVSRVAMMVSKMPRVPAGTSPSEIRHLARRWRMAAVPIEAADGSGDMLGYVRVVDLLLDDQAKLPLRPLVDVTANETYIATLVKLYDSGESLGRVRGSQGETVGFVTIRHLTEPLFRGQ